MRPTFKGPFEFLVFPLETTAAVAEVTAGDP
jgi:hypothetical protein